MSLLLFVMLFIILSFSRYHWAEYEAWKREQRLHRKVTRQIMAIYRQMQEVGMSANAAADAIRSVGRAVAGLNKDVRRFERARTMVNRALD